MKRNSVCVGNMP